MKKGTSKCRGRHMLEAPPKRGRYHFRGGANVKRTTLKVTLGWKKPPFLVGRQGKRALKWGRYTIKGRRHIKIEEASM